MVQIKYPSLSSPWCHNFHIFQVLLLPEAKHKVKGYILQTAWCHALYPIGTKLVLLLINEIRQQKMHFSLKPTSITSIIKDPWLMQEKLSAIHLHCPCCYVLHTFPSCFVSSSWHISILEKKKEDDHCPWVRVGIPYQWLTNTWEGLCNFFSPRALQRIRLPKTLELSINI